MLVTSVIPVKNYAAAMHMVDVVRGFFSLSLDRQLVTWALIGSCFQHCLLSPKNEESQSLYSIL